MRTEHTELHCASSSNGQKLMKYLLKTTDATKIFLYKLFRKGAIKVNGVPVDQTCVLKEGDVISFPLLRVDGKIKNKFRSVSRDLDVLYENDMMIAVDKNDSTLVHAADSEYKNSLLEMVKSYLYHHNQPYTEVCPVHRIDRNTRGVVLFAKDLEAAKKINALFKNGEVEKTYTALLIGKIFKTMFFEADIVHD